MTKNEAIELLKLDRAMANFNPITGEEMPMNEENAKSVEALDMAIEALSVKIVHCKDCIKNRKNVDGVAENWCYKFGYEVDDYGFCNYGDDHYEVGSVEDIPESIKVIQRALNDILYQLNILKGYLDSVAREEKNSNICMKCKYWDLTELDGDTSGWCFLRNMPKASTEKAGSWETKVVKHMCPRDAWYPDMFAIEDSWDEEEGSYLVEEDGFCSVCGKQDKDYSAHNYCHYCGARMESD